MSHKKMHSKVLATFMALLLALPLFASFIAPTQASAAIDPNTKGSVVITGTMPGEQFVATRVIQTNYQNGYLAREFAPGFSYGSNSENRSDNGLAAYLALTSHTAPVADAVEQFCTQMGDGNEAYRAVAEGDTCTIDNLPMGQYVIVATPVDAGRVYAKMVGNVEPVINKDTGEYEMKPAEVIAKAETFVVETPAIEIEKSANAVKIIPGMDIEYKVVVKPTEDSTTIRNLHIADALTPETVELGVALNQDVEVVDQNGEEHPTAVITYTSVNDTIVGYTIDIPGEFDPETQFIVTYTASTEGVEVGEEIVNIAKAWCDDVSPVSDEVTVLTDEEFVETGNDPAPVPDDTTPTSTPTQDIVKIFQTGDVVPFLIGGVALAAIIGLIVAAVIRRRRS